MKCTREIFFNNLAALERVTWLNEMEAIIKKYES